MEWYRWFGLAAFAICLASCFYHFTRLIRLGKPVDFSEKRGNVAKAVGYAFTGAMDPRKKESAYLHLPTYTAGILYHIGTFTAFITFILILFNVKFGITGKLILSVIFFVSSFAGIAVLIKRIGFGKLRALSNPDDYVSNILVTLFHIISALMLLYDGISPVYFLLAGLLMLYLPLGKLKHTVYFFAARYHLGFFYGWRGVWPPG